LTVTADSTFDNCTRQCENEPHICNCDFMPGRAVYYTHAHNAKMKDAYERYHWSDSRHPPYNYPTPPWVLENMRRYSESIGALAIAIEFRRNLTRIVKK